MAFSSSVLMGRLVLSPFDSSSIVKVTLLAIVMPARRFQIAGLRSGGADFGQGYFAE
jgi:hypothetical protein